MEKFNIVFSSDNQYIQHLTATLTSMLENTKHAEHIIINILDGGIDATNREFLMQLIHRYNSEIKFLHIDHELLKDVVVNGHITEATYYRILIPSLFDNTVSKVIYLDCDLVIRQDIYDFWKIDIGNKALGAIKINEYNRHKELGIPQSSSYFNAGVLVINIAKWKENNIIARVMKFISQYPERLMMWDQDALNGVLYDDWFEIEYTWNLRTQVFSLDYKAAGFTSETEFNQVKNNPAILHFTTGSKPWHYLNLHPFKEEYFKYLDRSLFPYIKFSEKEFLDNNSMVVFGTGKYAEQITDRLQLLGIEIAYYTDNNTEKWGSYFFGKIIKKPSALLEETSIFIIIASQYHSEIASQLEGMGLKAHYHFLKDISDNTEIRL